MARPRGFDEETVLAQARTLFATQGYNGTSIDDLVKATGLLRGSLYKASGSKRHLFDLVLTQTIANFEVSGENLDLLTVALKDLAQSDVQIRERCLQLVSTDRDGFAQLLGRNLLEKLKGS